MADTMSMRRRCSIGFKYSSGHQPVGKTDHRKGNGYGYPRGL